MILLLEQYLVPLFFALALVTYSLCLTGSKFSDSIRRRLKADEGFPAVEASSIQKQLLAHMDC